MKNNSKLLLSLLLMSGLTLGGCDQPGNSSSTSEQTPPTSDTNTGSGSVESSSSSSSSSSTPTPTISVAIATPASTEVEVGKTLQLTATITNGPADAKATWTSSDDSVATVSADGLVTGVKAGKATITAAYGGATDTVELTIKEAAPAVAVKITAPASTEVEVGKTLQLAATLTNAPADAKATWSTSDATIATVSADGLVTGVKAGKATITAAYGGATDTVEITVKEAAPVIGVEISAPASTEVEIGKTLQLTATVTNGPAGAKATWASSDSTIASVSADGLVTGLKAGSVTITASYGGASDTIVLTIKEPPVPTYDITLVADAGITASLPDKSVAGKTVHFRLTYEATKLAITSVKANDLVCGQDGDGNYYFVMPAEAVTITVTSTAVVSQTTATVKNETAEVADVVGLGSTAVVGSTAEFYLVMKPGFNFNSLSLKVHAFRDEPIDFTTKTIDGKTVYSFVVPAGEILINVNATRSSFALRYEDEFITNVYQTKVGSDSRKSCYYDVAEFGADVEVQLRSNATAKVKGIKIVETGLTVELKEGATSVHFTMPARSITIEVLTEAYYRNFNIVNSEHLTVEAFVEDENGDPTVAANGKAIAGQTVYLKVSGVSDTIGLKSLNVTYYEGYNHDLDLLEKGPNAAGFYTFEMPEVDDGTVIEVAEKNMTLFEGQDFVGQYLGFEIYHWSGYKSQTSSSSFSANMSPTIDGSGEFKYLSDDYAVVSAENNVAVVRDEEGNEDKMFAYNGKLIFSSYRLSSFDNSDIFIGVKKQSADDSDSIYTFEYELFGNNSYAAVQVYRADQPYASAFIDIKGTVLSEPNYYLDVEFDFVTGERITDDNAHYVVKDAEGNALTEVGYRGEGGVNNRIILDGLQGTYDAAAGDTYNLGDLVLDGAGGATLGSDIASTYKVGADGSISISHGKDTYMISLDTEAKTYTVTNHTVAENEFIGNTYSATFYSDWDECDYLASIVFYDASTCYFQISGPSGQPVYVPNSSNQGIPQSYTISGSTITVNAKGQSGEDLTVTLTINDDGTLTIDGDISNVYSTGGTVLTKQAA